MLLGRDRQRVAVDALLDHARAGRGGALVLRGGPGTGKTALLRAARRAAADFADDPRLVLLCVDDAHLLDLSALLTLLPDLTSEPVAVLLACETDLPHLPSVELTPLTHPDSLRVLHDLRPGLPADLAADLAHLACGNPLALVELAAALTAEHLGGTAPAPTALPADSLLRSRLRARFHALSPRARTAAALSLVDPDLDPDTLARLPDVGPAAVQEAAPLLTPGPLTRTTLAAELPLSERYAAHTTLAKALPPGPRRTWHQAATAPGARDAQAERLHAEARRARRCGDHVRAARDHDRAAALTSAPALRARRLVSAAADHWTSGSAGPARSALTAAARLSDSPELRALADLVRGGLDLGGGQPDGAARRLLRAAADLAGAHRAQAALALGFAGEAACSAGDHALHTEIAHAAAALRAPDDPDPQALVLDHVLGMEATFRGRHAEAVPLLRAVVATAERTPVPQAGVWGGHAAYVLGDSAKAHELAGGAVVATRERGLTAFLPWALIYQALSALLLDRHALAFSAAFEGLHAAEAVGQRNAAADHLMILALLSALRGDCDTALHRVDTAAEQVSRHGLGRAGTLAAWALACVDLARERPVVALERLRALESGGRYGGVHEGIRTMAVPHLVEAAAGCGEVGWAERELRRFRRWADSGGSAARQAVVHRCLGVLADGDAAREHFTEALRLHRGSGGALELARTQLVHGRWLRRSRRPRAAREVLREAADIFERQEAEHWAARARAELRAAGETAPGGERTVERTGDRPGGRPGGRSGGGFAELTPQQARIARLVAEGASNREVAARLFLSHRTVEHHLRNIFARLEVRSRVELVKRFG
ncbi:helix-turn-helix domain-containing protein [Actinosynnema mirum]|uniref:Transcriptional regulator, LuxR family n=1 Tax=Actinosynnema mirum (strain ATCC 29888 / DSM 43827 / JCM 3225 / NBRC 14064 / NCIMB 13271 / NRRL B-12336 / IMRU 3971 / 101) TaxID=446462 RepID=C6WFI3_ACTMD|nr:helix-turn-helix transcriptional regulator [Actinosynnema mirum]ACU35918.1 transcriptional regulator, LuxR family [Actinosynnema mirum DSM 43827]